MVSVEFKLEGDKPGQIVKQKFKNALNVVNNLPKEGSFTFTNEEKLKMYALYKQATVGPATASQVRPSLYDVVARAQWDSWRTLKNMSKSDAMTQYFQQVKQFLDRRANNSATARLIQMLDSDLTSQNESSSSAASPASVASSSFERLASSRSESKFSSSPTKASNNYAHRASIDSEITPEREDDTIVFKPRSSSVSTEPFFSSNQDTYNDTPLLKDDNGRLFLEELNNSIDVLEQHINKLAQRTRDLDEIHQRARRNWQIRFWIVFLPLLLFVIRHFLAPRIGSFLKLV